MTNNDIFRRLRYILHYPDELMLAIMRFNGAAVSIQDIQDWLKKDDDPEGMDLSDKYLAIFLEGLIERKRGKREGVAPQIEKKLNNNVVLRKLKIAFSLKNEDILEILELANRKISKHELSAFFRNPDQSQYRECKDQILRNFLHGLQLKYRDNKTA